WVVSVNQKTLPGLPCFSLPRTQAGLQAKPFYSLAVSASSLWGTTGPITLLEESEKIMKRFVRLLGTGVLAGSLGILALGCGAPPAEQKAAEPIAVQVSYPVAKEVTDYSDATGRVAAIDSVEIRARVWGYLDKVNFKEGMLVKKGDVLFEIDPR